QFLFLSFAFSPYQPLHSFPTRRSSDLSINHVPCRGGCSHPPGEVRGTARPPGEHCPPLRFNPLHLSPNIPYPPPRQRSHNQAGGGGEGEVPEHWDEVGVDIAVHFGEQHPAQRGKSAQNPDARNRPEPRRRAAVARDANAKRRRKRRGPDAEQRPRRKT